MSRPCAPSQAAKTPPPYLARMDEPALPAALAAQDAAIALIMLGFPVQPHGPDMHLWRIGCLIWTSDELLSFAARQGVKPAPERLQ